MRLRLRLKLLAVFWIFAAIPQFLWAAETYLYTLSEPLEITTELGPISRTAHVLGESSFQLMKAALVFHATGQPSVALAMLGIESAKMPPMITAQSIADLQLRDWFKQQKKVKELSGVPHLQKVSILTTSTFEVKTGIAKSQSSQGIVFLETDAPLEPGVALPEGWGKPVLVDPKKTRLRLELNVRGEPNVIQWSPRLSDVVSAEPKPLPNRIRQAWSKHVDELDQGKSWFQQHFSHHDPSDLKIEAAIVTPNGNAIEFKKPLAQGAAVEKILGKTFFQKLLTAAGKMPGRVPVSNFKPQQSCGDRFLRLFGKP